jgi:hypothetical protein
MALFILDLQADVQPAGVLRPPAQVISLRRDRGVEARP